MQALSLQMRREDKQVADALQRVGIRVNSVYDLVNSSSKYPSAIPVLVDQLAKVSDQKIKEGIARALTVKEARPIATAPLVHEFKQTEDEVLRWVIGNAFAFVADQSCVELLLPLARTRSFGLGRQMIVMALAKFKHPEIFPLLMTLLDDPDVAAQAVNALGKLGEVGAKEKLETLLDDPNSLIKKEAKKALKKLKG